MRFKKCQDPRKSDPTTSPKSDHRVLATMSTKATAGHNRTLVAIRSATTKSGLPASQAAMFDPRPEEREHHLVRARRQRLPGVCQLGRPPNRPQRVRVQVRLVAHPTRMPTRDCHQMGRSWLSSVGPRPEETPCSSALRRCRVLETDQQQQSTTTTMLLNMNDYNALFCND